MGGELLGMAGGAASTTVQLLLMVLLAVLLALDPRSHQRLVLAATPAFYRPRMQLLLGECRRALGGWLAGMTLSALVVFLASWAGLVLLEVPLALLCGLVCGLFTFVPTIGPFAASLLAMAVALAVSPAKALQVLLLRLVLQNAEAFLLTPLLLRRTVNLLPTVALMAQLSLGALLGLPGLLLALPLVVVLQVIGQAVLVRDVMDRWERP
jgi:predicted PurR-regulated permease PerM